MHGTRARYVSGCRCAPCRDANRIAYHERERRALAAAAAAPAVARAGIRKPWRAPDGTVRLRTYGAACPGLEGEPCRRARHLRRDSKHGLCGDCRLRLVWNGLVDAGPARRHLRALSRQGVGYKSVAAASDVGSTTLARVLAGTKKTIRRETERRILEVDAAARADSARVPAAPTWRRLETLIEEYFSKAEVARQLGLRKPALQIGRRRVTARTELRVRRLYERAVGAR